MNQPLIDKIRDQEVTLKFSRAGGPGGQHVNKTETKVQLSWQIENTSLFPSEQVEQLKQRYASYITKNIVLKLEDSKTRQRGKNIERVRKKFSEILLSCFEIPKERNLERKKDSLKKQNKKRLKEKKKRKDIKQNRKKVDW